MTEKQNKTLGLILHPHHRLQGKSIQNCTRYACVNIRHLDSLQISEQQILRAFLPQDILPVLHQSRLGTLQHSVVCLETLAANLSPGELLLTSLKTRQSKSFSCRASRSYNQQHHRYITEDTSVQEFLLQG